jgi:hypothetical protein
MIGIASVEVLALFAFAGYGWSRATLGAGTPAVALAPGFGAATLMLAAIAADRTGVPLTGRAGPIAVAAVATVGGYLVAGVAARRARRSGRRPQVAGR